MSLKYTYIFILGRYPDLSQVEVFSVLNLWEVTYTIILKTNQALIIQTDEKLDIVLLNKTLGGSVKIGKVIDKLVNPVSEKELCNYFTSDALFIDFLENVSEKIAFGISYYADDKIADKGMHYTLAAIIKTIKTHLELQGFKVRYPKLEGTSLSSASVDKNQLLTKGAEILLIQTKDSVIIGKTLAVQEFESFSKRDYGRPSRDMDSGIMPPKIARMMINLAEIKKDAMILDPFCGSGTVLQEAAVLGFTHVTGTDISEKAVIDSEKNLTWLTQRNTSVVKPDIRQCDVFELEAMYGQASFDAIIGEPYMGPNFQQRPLLSTLQKNRDDLELFYAKSLEIFTRVLRPNGVIVMILPIFHTSHHYLHMDISAKINTLGLKLIPLSENKRQTITVGNNFDYVLREIIKFKKEPIPLSF